MNSAFGFWLLAISVFKEQFGASEGDRGQRPPITRRTQQRRYAAAAPSLLVRARQRSPSAHPVSRRVIFCFPVCLAAGKNLSSHPFVQKRDERVGHPRFFSFACLGHPCFCYLRMNRDSKTFRFAKSLSDRRSESGSGLKGWIPGRQGGSSAEIDVVSAARESAERCSRTFSLDCIA